MNLDCFSFRVKAACDTNFAPSEGFGAILVIQFVDLFLALEDVAPATAFDAIERAIDIVFPDRLYFKHFLV